jgi:hypothetical protein
MMFSRRSLPKRQTKTHERRSVKPARRGLRFECLERRELLSAAGAVDGYVGVLPKASTYEYVSMTVSPRFAGNVCLRIQAASWGGDNFDPAAVKVRVGGSSGSLVAPIATVANLQGTKDSAAVVSLGSGSYTICVFGGKSLRTTYEVGSQFELNVFVVGDIDGSGAVTQSDLLAIRQCYGARLGDGAYTVAADANLDGQINAVDLSMAIRNIAPSAGLAFQFTPTVAQAYTTLPGYVYDAQNTMYTCGPSSLSMALSELGITETESKLAAYAGTTTEGTTHAGLSAAVATVDAKYDDVTLAFTERNFSSLGSSMNERYAALAVLLANPNVSVIIHGKCAGWTSYYSSTSTAGHYVFPVAVNTQTSTIRVADPLRGVIVYGFSEFLAGINLVTGQGSVLIVTRAPSSSSYAANPVVFNDAAGIAAVVAIQSYDASGVSATLSDSLLDSVVVAQRGVYSVSEERKGRKKGAVHQIWSECAVSAGNPDSPSANPSPQKKLHLAQEVVLQSVAGNDIHMSIYAQTGCLAAVGR